MKRLLILSLMTLAACNTKQATDIGYTTFEAQQAQAKAAECVGVATTSVSFLPNLGTVQGLKILGNYNWTTNIITLHADLDYPKQPTQALQDQWKRNQYYIIAHELAHKRQKESGWIISDPSIPWALRPEEIDAESTAIACLVKFDTENAQK